MLTDRELKEILDFSSPGGVLSVYLNIDPTTEGNAEAQKLRLRQLLMDVDLPKDKSVVLEYFERAREWKGRSVAIFSCAGRGFFRAYSLAVPVSSQVRVGDHPYFKPLADLLDAYGGYGVVLVDKQGARLFLFHLGELVEQEGFLGENIRHSKSGGASSVPGRRGGVAGQTRYADEVTDRNSKAMVEAAVHFFEQNRVRRILIGGTEENTARFRHHLPKAWQSLVIGTFPIEMNARAAEVLARAMEIGHRAETARETRLVSSIMTRAAKGSDGTIRLNDTLDAIRSGRVQMLVIREGYHAPGYQCEGCGYLTAKELKVCSFCGKDLRRIDDAVEMAVREVMRSGGEVEVVRSNPELEQVGIGALLRY